MATAPNVQAIVSPSSASDAAAIGLKPSTMSSGAAITAGVPNPDMPSSKAINENATTTVCTRISGDIEWRPSFMRSIAPVSCMVLTSVRAPNKISPMVRAR